MSKENATNFIKRLQTDAVLRQKVNDVDHVVKVAKDHGFDVTHEELKTALQAHWGDDPASKVLSEAPGF